MRKPINPTDKCKTRGISLPPELERFASKRAFDAGISFSQYLQLFVRLDRKENLLPRALLARLNAAAQ